MMLSNDQRVYPAVGGLSHGSSSRVPSRTHTDAAQREAMKPEQLQHIWIITGPTGSGKSTVAKYLKQELKLPFLEGDDFHPQSNKDKMSNGTPLTDADRWDWLISLRDTACEILCPSASNNYQPPSGVIMTCSALKQKYRDVMRVAAYGHPTVRIHFIYLKAEEDVLMRRVHERKSHYMKSHMVHSQFEALEEPTAEWDTLAVDVAAPRDEVQRRVSAVVAAKLAEYEC